MAASKTNKQLDKHDDKLHAQDYGTAIGTLDETSTRDGAGPSGEPYWGTGNTVKNYNISVNHKADVELGLKIHEYRGADILPTPPAADGTASYVAPSGMSPLNGNRAAWNFDFSVNTGIEGSNQTLDAFDFRIVVESGDGERAVFNLQHNGPGNTPWQLAGAPADLGFVGFKDEDGSNAQVSQNSVNMSFDFMKAVFGTDYNSSGEHYDIYLQAFDHNRLIASVHDSIDIL
jgi:hypothetical protein